MARLENFTKGCRIFGISIMNQIAAVGEKAPFVHRHVSGHLLHPSFVGMGGHAGDHYSTAFEMNEEEHIESHQAAKRKHLGGKEVYRQVPPSVYE